MFGEQWTAYLLLRGVDEVERREILSGRATRVSSSVLWWVFHPLRAGSDKGATKPRCFTVKPLS